MLTVIRSYSATAINNVGVYIKVITQLVNSNLIEFTLSTKFIEQTITKVAFVVLFTTKSKVR